MYFSCPILETADYKWQDQTLRLNLCALINWQIKPNAASGVFHESFISFSNCLIVWIFPFCLNFLTSILQLFSSRNKTMTQYITTDVHFDYLDACSSSGGGHCNFLFPFKNQLVKTMHWPWPLVSIQEPDLC